MSAVPPNFPVKEAVFYNAFAGDYLEIPCTFRGYPTPSGSWCKLAHGGKQCADKQACSKWLSYQTYVKTDRADNAMLRIPVVRDCDAGNYLCNVTNEALTSGIQRVIHINVTCMLRSF